MAAVSGAQPKVTLSELLDTLRLLEEEPEVLPPLKACRKDGCAWMDGVGGGLRLVASIPGRRQEVSPWAARSRRLLGGGGWEMQLAPCQGRQRRRTVRWDLGIQEERNCAGPWRERG